MRHEADTGEGDDDADTADRPAWNASEWDPPAPRAPADDTESADARAVLHTLGKSNELLAVLATGPKRKATLADELDVSKSTVYNWADELIDYGFVLRCGEGYRLTANGRLHLQLYRRCETVSAAAARAAPVLSGIPPEEFPPIEIVEDAAIVTDLRDPAELRCEFERGVEQADRLVGLAPIVYVPQIEILQSIHAAGDLDLELVFDRKACAYLQANCPEFCRALIDVEDSALYETGDRVPIGLLVFDGPEPMVALASTDERGYPTGYVLTQATKAVEWGRRLYQEYRTGGTCREVRSPSSAR